LGCIDGPLRGWTPKADCVVGRLPPSRVRLGPQVVAFKEAASRTGVVENEVDELELARANEIETTLTETALNARVTERFIRAGNPVGPGVHLPVCSHDNPAVV
jgi:hypothetical protein